MDFHSPSSWAAMYLLPPCMLDSGVPQRHDMHEDHTLIALHRLRGEHPGHQDESCEHAGLSCSQPP